MIFPSVPFVCFSQFGQNDSTVNDVLVWIVLRTHGMHVLKGFCYCHCKFVLSIQLFFWKV